MVITVLKCISKTGVVMGYVVVETAFWRARFEGCESIFFTVKEGPVRLKK